MNPPAGYQPTTIIRDLTSGHPWLQSRFAKLSAVLTMRGFPLFVNEVFRYDLRQGWLFGSGRSPEVCRSNGVDPRFSRPNEPVVTNAWSAGTSAHGFTLIDGVGQTIPASCAIDVVPVGPDGIPWTKDDDWSTFLDHLESDANACGLRHFRNASGQVSDKPHLQLVEFCDAHHALCRLVHQPLTAA